MLNKPNEVSYSPAPSTAPTRLLILSCSQRKLPDAGELPALERYDGPPYRVLRRYLRTTPAPDVAVLILSARYGIITANTPIAWYDQRMTVSRAAALREDIERTIAHYLDTHAMTASCICMGTTYRAALGAAYAALFDHGPCTVLSGSMGAMLAGLHNWLSPIQPSAQHAEPVSTQQMSHPCLRGVVITLTREQVWDRARQALAAGHGDPTHYAAWYVVLDGQRVAPKWVVSSISGIPVGRFSTDDARRVLRQLGVEVYRL